MGTRKVSGFAVTELLTVIAIIAILAVVFVPVLARARECRHAPADLSLRQAARTAASLYSEDYDGVQPHWNMSGASSLTASFSGQGDCLPTAPANFVSANGGCQDTVTGLTWSAPGHEVSGSAYLYSGAVYYCAHLNEQGYTGWRMPTQSELSKFSSDGAYNAVLDDYSLASKWSSTAVNGHSVLAVYLKTGAVTSNDKRYNALDAICVK